MRWSHQSSPSRGSAMAIEGADMMRSSRRYFPEQASAELMQTETRVDRVS